MENRQPNTVAMKALLFAYACPDSQKNREGVQSVGSQNLLKSLSCIPTVLGEEMSP